MKQTNNAIKFLMAQYRAIFKNANIAMVAAMAAAALAAGQAQAAAISDWNNVSGGSLDGTQDQTITITQKGSVENKNGFDLTIKSGTHTIQGDGSSAGGVFTVAEGKPSAIKLEATGDAGQNTFTIGDAAANKNATVTIDSFTNKKGTLSIQGNAADKGKTSALNAKVIKIGIDSKAANDAVVTVKGHGSLNATGTGSGEGLLIGKGAKITVEENGKITASNLDMSDGSLTLSAANTSVTASTMNLTKGTVTLSGAATSTLFGDKDSTIVINGATITDGASNSGTVKGKSITLTSGKLASSNNLHIDSTGGEFIANGGSIENNTKTKNITFRGNTKINDGVTVSNSGNLIFIW